VDHTPLNVGYPVQHLVIRYRDREPSP